MGRHGVKGERPYFGRMKRCRLCGRGFLLAVKGYRLRPYPVCPACVRGGAEPQSGEKRAGGSRLSPGGRAELEAQP